MNRKSDSCYGRRTGEPLTVYNSSFEAQQGADYANREYGNNLAPYKCERCGLWHLSPKDRQTPSVTCPSCTDRDGHHKDLYRSKTAAETRVAILQKEAGVCLGIYKCPYHDGWHLTKKISEELGGEFPRTATPLSSGVRHCCYGMPNDHRTPTY